MTEALLILLMVLVLLLLAAWICHSFPVVEKVIGQAIGSDDWTSEYRGPVR